MGGCVCEVGEGDLWVAGVEVHEGHGEGGVGSDGGDVADQGAGVGCHGVVSPCLSWAAAAMAVAWRLLVECV